jgi:hypothetical protein
MAADRFEAEARSFVSCGLGGCLGDCDRVCRAAVALVADRLRAAERRGAERMRERIAIIAEREGWCAGVRALPLEEPSE